jgi:hypothetical protein
MTDPDIPIVSNPEPKRDTRGLRERLEVDSSPAVQGGVHAVLLHLNEELHDLSPTAVCHLRHAAALCAAVREWLAGEAAERVALGRADDMVLQLRFERTNGTIRANAHRFGTEAKIVHPHQVLEIAADRGQIAATLVRVRPRSGRPMPLIATEIMHAHHHLLVKDHERWVETPTGYEALLGGTDDRGTDSAAPPPGDGPAAPAGRPASGDAVDGDGSEPK